MPKKADPGGLPPLSRYWMPPERLDGLSEPGVGEPMACLATTFEFDAGFFEAELLPRFLGLKFDQTENEPSFVVEREEHLALVRAAVLVDASRFDAGQTTLRWDQLPVRVPGGLLHAKITVLHWEHLVRAIVASANLTRPGYRRNREVFAALDFWDSSDSVPLNLLNDILELLIVSAGWACAAPTVRDRTTETIDGIRRAARRWNQAPRDFKPRQRPRATLAVTCPKTARSQARSALSEVLDAWSSRRATSVCVVTPFVGQDSLAGRPDRVVKKLLEIPRARDCQGFLVVPEAPRNDGEETSRVELPAGFGQSWQEAITPSQAFVLPVPLRVEGKEHRNRDLHTKATLLESNDDVLLMVGSSNFTPHGMGIDAFNVEANLLFIDRAAQRDGMLFSDRFGLPLAWNDAQSVDDLIWQEPKEPPADQPLAGSVPPGFFAWSSYSQQTGALLLELDREQWEPGDWKVSLPGSTRGGGLVVFSRSGDAEPPRESPLRYQMPEQARGVSIVVLIVDWVDGDGQWHPAKLGVCAESPESLLPPSEFRELGAEAIIDCLISGKSPSQWFDQRQRAMIRDVSNSAAIESLRAIETSGYLFYRVRRFGRALAAMRERIAATPPRPDAICYRLLLDPFGPVPLALKLLDAADETAVAASARLDAEHRVFLVAELLLTVGLLRARFYQATRGKNRDCLAALFREAERKLEELVEADGGCLAAALPDNLKRYVTAIRDRIDSPEQDAVMEAQDAG